jgi:hypothetical protein
MSKEHQAAYVERQLQEDPEGFHARRRAAVYAWRKRNLEKTRAHSRVARAIKKGTLVRPDTCERCGEECRPEASHDDYSKPLEVEWLCRLCHARKDNRRD